MASSHSIATVHKDALSDPQLSPQSVSLAATMVTGGSVEGLRFSEATTDLAVWELDRAGHLSGVA